jgi:TRAP transporter TAXI family solute receptor
MRNSVPVLAVVLGLCLIAGGEISAKQITLTFTAGSAGGGWYGIAGGIAPIIQEYDPELVIKVVPGGGVKNPAVISNGTVEMGFGLPFMNAAAYQGLAPFEKPLKNLRALVGGMVMNYFHFYVGEEVPVNSMDEVFGEKKKLRMAVTQPGSSDVWVFERILGAYKTGFEALEEHGFHFARGNYSFQANQFKDKNVDGVFTFLSLPGAAVIEASVGRPLKLIDFSDTALKHLDQYGIVPGEIPAGTYPKAVNNDKAIRTAKAGSVITVSAEMPEEIAYRLTKAFNENVAKIRKIHAALQPYTVDQGVTGCGVPLHPGAVRYYKEKGVIQ